MNKKKFYKVIISISLFVFIIWYVFFVELILCSGIFSKITSHSDIIFPITLNINLKQYNEIKDYKINRNIVVKSLNNTKCLKSKFLTSITFYSLLYDSYFYKGNYYDEIEKEKQFYPINIEHCDFSFEKGDYNYNVVMYNPDIVTAENNNNKQTKIINYDRKKINKENLYEYCVFNIIEFNGYDDRDKNKNFTRNDYDKKRFTQKAKIEKNKNSTIILYPTEYYPFARHMSEEWIEFFKYKYGQNILICQDNTIMQIKVFSNTKKYLVRKTVDFTNDILTQFHKASEDKNYKIDLIKYKEE